MSGDADRPRPYVVVHSMISVDGRLDGFPADLGLYYELAGALPHQAVLSGSGTLLAAAAREGVDPSGDDAPGDPEARDGAALRDDPRPWLVVVDSRGQLTRLDWLRAAPFWREVFVLCSRATPAAHVDRLRAAGVPHELVGEQHVDLAAALSLLADHYGVEAVRVDAGPTLNGALLSAGLVDELSLVVAPHVVGHHSEHSLHLAEGLATGGSQALALASAETLRDGYTWLRYTVAPVGGEHRCSNSGRIH